MPNSKRQRLPIPWGEGIDRSSGAMAIAPGAFRDLRDVHLGNGRTELRLGLPRLKLLPSGDMVLGVWPIRAQGLAAAAVYDIASRTVSLYVIDATGTAEAFIGTLFTISTAAASPPSLIGAASYDKLLIAHDEPVYAERQPTMVYTPLDGVITPLLADFAREGGAFPVKFRGVATHLNYIVGWGYGQHNTNPAIESEDRPETLRISDPGEPTVFIPEHYFLVGMQGDPIVGAGQVAQRLAIFKAAEAYQLVGYDRPTFGIQPLDPQHGLLASKLHVSVSGALFFWSLAGPRVMAGDGSTDLAEPLGLTGPAPDPLAVATPPEQGFAYYDRDRDEVIFVFGQWGYVLHLAGAQRWSYRKFGVGLACAGRIYLGGTTVIAPPPGVEVGVASYIDPTYVPGDADPKFYVPWTWSSASAGQRAEVWLKESVGGTWALRANVPAANGFAIVAEPNGTFLANYDIQVRFTQFGIPAPGYEGSDPDLWPSDSLVTVLAIGTPAFFSPGRFHRYSPTEVGFNAGILRGPGVNQSSPAAYVWEANYYDFDTATWNPITLAATPPWQEIRLPNAMAGKTVLLDIRATRVGAPVIGGFFLTTGIKVQPEPPSGVFCGGTDTPGGPNDGTDHHVVTWNAPALVPGPVAPADGPYDVRIRHYDTLSFIGPWSSITAVGFATHATTIAAPGVDPSTTGSRTAEAQVRSNNGLGDVSDWVSATTFEP
jgi:hypothetical protein